jgi:hypothetical protein
MEAVGYVPVRNPDAKDGLWRICDRRQVVYSKMDLTVAEQIDAAQEWAKTAEKEIKERAQKAATGTPPY